MDASTFITDLALKSGPAIGISLYVLRWAFGFIDRTGESMTRTAVALEALSQRIDNQEDRHETPARLPA